MSDTATCSHCRSDIPNPTDCWPDTSGGVLCQDCWELDVDEEWWDELMERIE